jgi:hypothetical protein
VFSLMRLSDEYMQRPSRSRLRKHKVFPGLQRDGSGYGGLREARVRAAEWSR